MDSTNAIVGSLDRRSIFAKEVLTAGEARPWTTTRCQRLLRPLQSRIASVRRDLATPGDASAIVRVPPTPVRNDKSSQHEWLVSRRKPCRTYSQRRLREGAQHCDELPVQDVTTMRTLREGVRADAQHDQIYPSTPLLRRARGHLMSSPLVARDSTLDTPCELSVNGNQEGPNKGKRQPAERNEHLAALRKHCTSSRYMDLEAIYRSFEALLIATRDTQPARAGTRSLLGTCLRRVPEYIAGVEAWERHEANEEGNVLNNDGINTRARIYMDLEQVGAGNGWKHLRSVARADGIRSLTTAVEDGLWPPEFSQILTDLCIRHSALPEAEKLMSAQSERVLFEASVAESSRTNWFDAIPHRSLLDYAKKTGKETFVFEQYRHFISHSLFPATWLVSEELDEIWNMAVGRLARSRAATEAVNFVTAILTSTGGRLPQTCSSQHNRKLTKSANTEEQHTVIGGLATIASMSFLGDSELTQLAFNRERLVKIGDRLRYILHCCVTSCRQRRKFLSNSGYSLACIALLCSMTGSENDEIASGLRQSMQALWKQKALHQPGRNSQWREHLDIITSFISSMSITCSRGTGETPQHFLDVFIIGRLRTLDLDAHILDDLKTAAAFHVARKTNNVRDLIYAENLHRGTTLPDSGNVLQTSAGNASRNMPFTGWSWDDTIGEWVTTSPLSKNSSKSSRGTTTRPKHAECAKDDVRAIAYKDQGSVDLGAISGPSNAPAPTSNSRYKAFTGRSRSSLPAPSTYKAFSLDDDDDDDDDDDEASKTSDIDCQGSPELPERPLLKKAERPRQLKDRHKDELADDLDEEDKENSRRCITQRLPPQKRAGLQAQHDAKRRRRTHSGIFAARECHRRDSSTSSVSRVTSSRAFRRAGVSDSDDELGL